MTDQIDLVVEALNKTHDRAQFASGIVALDTYLQKQASQDVKRKIARVFVATRPTSPSTIVGFYTLSSLSIDFEDLPEDVAKKLPQVPVPVALIGRFAVSEQEQKNGIGKLLLANAILRTLKASEDIAIYAIVVDPIDEKAGGYYQKLGFSRLSGSSSRMYLPLRSS